MIVVKFTFRTSLRGWSTPNQLGKLGNLVLIATLSISDKTNCVLTVKRPEQKESGNTFWSDIPSSAAVKALASSNPLYSPSTNNMRELTVSGSPFEVSFPNSLESFQYIKADEYSIDRLPAWLDCQERSARITRLLYSLLSTKSEDELGSSFNRS